MHLTAMINAKSFFDTYAKEFKSNIEFRKKWGYKMDINSKTGHYIDAIIDDGGISEQLKNK